MEEPMPYKSLRTAVNEAMATEIENNPQVWKTAGGCYGAKCKESGRTLYFDSEANANAWLKKDYEPAGIVNNIDTSTPVQLDHEGYEVKGDGKPTRGTPAPQEAKAGTSNPKRAAQPKSSGANTKPKEPAKKKMKEGVEHELGEAKLRYKKPKIAAPEDSNTDPRFARAAQPLKARKTDRFGNLVAARPTTADAKKTDASITSNLTTAADLIDLVGRKPVGTTFEIYGKKDGKEVSKKVKKVMKFGAVVFMIGTTEVQLVPSGTGLQVVNAQTRRIILDRGNDMIWESEDLCDVGRIFITE